MWQKHFLSSSELYSCLHSFSLQFVVNELSLEKYVPILPFNSLSIQVRLGILTLRI